MVRLIPWRSRPTVAEPTESLPLARLRTEMDRLFDTFLREPFGTMDWPWRTRETWMPAVDISEADNEFTVRAELPGIDPKDLEVTVVGSQLVLGGEKRETTEQTEKGYHHRESRHGTFRRAISLPVGVDPDHVEADYANGILTVHLKKTADASPKRIDVHVKG